MKDAENLSFFIGEGFKWRRLPADTRTLLLCRILGMTSAFRIVEWPHLETILEDISATEGADTLKEESGLGCFTCICNVRHSKCVVAIFSPHSVRKHTAVVLLI